MGQEEHSRLSKQHGQRSWGESSLSVKSRGHIPGDFWADVFSWPQRALKRHSTGSCHCL